MKHNLFLFATGFIFLLGFASCNSGSTHNEKEGEDTVSAKASQQTVQTDYSGVYSTQAESPCRLSITITKQNDGFEYQLSNDNQHYTGKLIIEEKDGEVYFTFDGKIEDNEPKSVEAQFVDGKIMIQNYGNAMNEFKFFKTCDEKYLEFIKS